MGIQIDKEEFCEEDYRVFEDRLRDALVALQLLIDRPGFGRSATTLGAELELSLVDEDYCALPLNRQLLEESKDPNLQLELDRFNIEYNLTPVASRGEPFKTLETQLNQAMSLLQKSASVHGGRVVPIGIVPTLGPQDLLPSILTDLPRYRALNAGIRRLRQAPFSIEINGPEPLKSQCDAVTLEGANTSFQIHLRVNPDEFAASYNATQLATPMALAVGANSPSFLGHFLWDETRIALFKQALDSRSPNRPEWRRVSRVPFGHGWVRTGPMELFAEAVALFPPVLPLMSDEDPIAAARAGKLPQLSELRLHKGTIWQWNRTIYDPSAAGHFRIEMRALPAGPTAVDMVANAAFLLGLVTGLRTRINELLPSFPFAYAEYNFYRAAEHGLEAELLWPTRSRSPAPRPVRSLIAELAPVAEEGLSSLGEYQSEIDRLLNLIRARLDTGRTGARWQRQVAFKLDKSLMRNEALSKMLALYLRHVETRKPVNEWPIEV